MNKKSELHLSIERNLKKYNLSLTSLPDNIEQWQNFVKVLNDNLFDIDQELYLLERSSDLAFKETNELSKNLKVAQRLASIGRWSYDRRNDKFSLSSEFYTVFKIDQGLTVKNRKQVMQLIHVDDVNILLSALDAAYKKNIDTECEVRLVLPNKKIIWFHITSHPIFNDDGNCEEFTGVAMEITNRKKAQEKIAQLNEKLVVSARNAGMAEVAVGILHNLGNILNSVNVSINVIKENVDKSYIPKLICVIDLIEKNIDTIGDYITQDKKGKIIPEYLVSLAKALNTQHDTFSKEFINVEKHIRHINNIVDSQQRLAKSSNVISYFSPAEIIDDALNICQHQKGNKDIRYNKCFDRSLLINSDKNKLLQVLVNLFRNANESMSKKNNYLKNEIKVILKKERKKYIKILVKDNGVGIEKENLSNIFSYGYTNKENGHGFGLHSCALFAKEMGGSLEVTSAGADKGATFTLTLPVNME